MTSLDEARMRLLQQDHGLSYHIPYALEAERVVGLKGKAVLEIGGSLPREFVRDDLGAARWIAIEELEYYTETHKALHRTFLGPVGDAPPFETLPDYGILNGRIEDLPPGLEGQFDIVFSIAAFEHINRLPRALDRMYRALKPGGQLFSMFSPIWSAHDGHHLHNVTDKLGRVHNHATGTIPPWGHLLMTPPQLYAYLLNQIDADTAAEIVYHVYHSTAINRLFTEDYLDYVHMTAFTKKGIFKTFEIGQVPPDIQNQLTQRHPGRQHFNNNGLMVHLVK